MEQITITIDWIFALGIIGTLLLVAWSASGRLGRVETNIRWLKKSVNDLQASVKELRVSRENERVGVFHNQSPINLTDDGQKILEESKLREYTDKNFDTLSEQLNMEENFNPYEIQENIFVFMNTYEFDDDYDEVLKSYAYKEGLDFDILRRVAAIYLRNQYMEKNNIALENIDHHNPKEQGVKK